MRQLHKIHTQSCARVQVSCWTYNTLFFFFRCTIELHSHSYKFRGYAIIICRGREPPFENPVFFNSSVWRTWKKKKKKEKRWRKNSRALCYWVFLEIHPSFSARRIPWNLLRLQRLLRNNKLATLLLAFYRTHGVNVCTCA